MLIGQTLQFTANDEHGHPRSDASWSVDNSSIASLSNDPAEPSLLTALAPGSVTLTATLGSVSTQTTVTVLSGASFPVGTVQWSAPPIPGLSTMKILQAVPTDSNTAALYAIDSDAFSFGFQGTYVVRAFSTDGHQLWSRSLENINKAMPDGFGGLLLQVLDSGSSLFTGLLDLDGVTGTELWRTTPDVAMPSAVRQDGTVFGAVNRIFFTLDGLSGQQTIQAPLPPSYATSIDEFGVMTTEVGTPRGPVSIGPDDQAYLLYAPSQTTCSGHFVDEFCGNSTFITGFSQTLFLLQISADNTVLTQPISSSNNSRFFPGIAVPLGQNETLLSWALEPLNGGPLSFNIAHLGAQGATTYQLPLDGIAIDFANAQIVLGENNTAFATDGTTVVSFDITSGQTNWTYTAPSQTTFSIISATACNGLVGKLTDQNALDTVIRFDPSGTATTDTWSASKISYAWNGDWNALQSGATASLLAPRIYPASSVSPMPEANPSGNSTSRLFTKDVMIISWINKNAILVPPTASVNPTLVSNLDAHFLTCPRTLNSLRDGDRSIITSDLDRQYANAFLIINSANDEPPDTLNSSILKNGNFRAYNEVQAAISSENNQITTAIFANPKPALGHTPDACHSPLITLFNLILNFEKAEAHPDNGKNGVTTSRLKVFQIVEGRVGPQAQAVNRTLNKCTSSDPQTHFCNNPVPPVTPYIWSVPLLDLQNQYTVNTQIFPTHYIYENGKLVTKIPQSALEDFISLDATSQITVSDIK